LGFSFIEIVSVVLVSGILASIIIPSFDDTSSRLNTTSWSKRFLLDLRRAQSIAMNSGQSLCVVVVSEGYKITTTATVGNQILCLDTPVSDPGNGQPFSVVFDNNVAISVPLNQATLIFDSLGRASTNAVFNISTTAKTVQIAITLGTGYITVLS
jgi:Tfp pilus assembly protein FimT